MLSTPAALLSTDEAERLRTLRHYNILQSLQEEVFDELAALTALVFHLPMAYIALIGRDEAEYKAAYGFAMPSPQPRAALLCALAVKQNQVVVYADIAAAIPTPLNATALRRAQDASIRFYAGAPLQMPGRHSIGTLCVAGEQPRFFSAAEQQVLEQLADITSLTIVVRHLCLNHPILGPSYWQGVQTQLRDEVYALGALMRYLTTRYGVQVPVPEDILQAVGRRLADLRDILEDHLQG